MTLPATPEDGARQAGAVLAAPSQPGARASQGGEGPGRRARGPIDPRLVRRARATRWFLVALVVVGVAGALLTLAQAWLLSRSIGGVFATGDAAPALRVLVPLAAVFGGKAVLAWLNQWLAQRAAASVKSQLRVDIMRARLERPLDSEASTGGLVTLVTQGLDALDGFYAKYLPQLVLAVVVPVIVGVAILTTDWLSTLIVALTLPLIPFFMALVGWTTEARTRRRFSLQTRLARHFADLVEGLPTLQVFGRARAQAEGLRRSEAAHRAETMATLRISFLSALVLELLATLSVAVVAVTTGFRVLFDQMDLTSALFILILAPEVYLPVRQVGVHYHDSADGMAAAEAAFALIDPPEGATGDSPELIRDVAPVNAGAPVVGAAAGGDVARSAPVGDALPARDGLSTRGLRPLRDSGAGSAGALVTLRSAELRSAAEAVPTPDHTPKGVPAVRSVDDGPIGDPSVSVDSGLDADQRSPAASATSVPGSSSVLGSSSVEARSAVGSSLAGESSGGAGFGADVLVGVVGLGHTYPGGSQPAVSGVSFDVRPGEFVVLTGPSGGGKTTVLNALLGFIRPSQGRVLVDGRPLDAASMVAWRRRIAYVGQNPGMISGTVRDNVLLGFPDAPDAELRSALDAAGGADLALEHPVGDDGQGLSAGERRRVATARALLRIRLGRAELLLLDEPTAGLDADAEATLLRGLRALGVAAVVVSHRPAVIAEADAVVEIGGVR